MDVYGHPQLSMASDTNGLPLNVWHLASMVEGHVRGLPVGIASGFRQGLRVEVVLNHLACVWCLWGEQVPWNLLQHSVAALHNVQVNKEGPKTIDAMSHLSQMDANGGKACEWHSMFQSLYHPHVVSLPCTTFTPFFFTAAARQLVAPATAATTAIPPMAPWAAPAPVILAEPWAGPAPRRAGALPGARKAVLAAPNKAPTAMVWAMASRCKEELELVKG
eukprot:Skav223496  [mRNA]  locus=scaffold1160:63063:63722:+ [translate_table: standard]